MELESKQAPVKLRSAGINILKDLALAHSRTRYPNMKEEYRSTRSYTDRTANGLTKCILDFLNFSGHQAERISNTGRLIDRRKVVSDILGNRRTIGSSQWIPSSGTKGTADVAACIWGRAVKIEIKMKDRQSPDQEAYQAQIERAGGVYWLVRSFDEFLDRYNELI